MRRSPILAWRQTSRHRLIMLRTMNLLHCPVGTRRLHCRVGRLSHLPVSNKWNAASKSPYLTVLLASRIKLTRSAACTRRMERRNRKDIQRRRVRVPCRIVRSLDRPKQGNLRASRVAARTRKRSSLPRPLQAPKALWRVSHGEIEYGVVDGVLPAG
jgi:hypothetical protein